MVKKEKEKAVYVETMADSGSITKYLSKDVLALEFVKSRVERGKEVAPDANWIVGDVFSKELMKIIAEKRPTIIVSNPDFGSIMAMVILAERVLELGGQLWLIAPEDYFSVSKRRLDYLAGRTMTIVLEKKLGKLKYGRYKSPKRTADSLFRFRKKDFPTKKKTLSWRTEIKVEG